MRLKEKKIVNQEKVLINIKGRLEEDEFRVIIDY